VNITEIHNTIEKKGYIEIPKFLHNDEFESLKKFVDEKIESIDNNFFLTDNSLNKIFIQNNEIYKKFLNLFIELLGKNNINPEEKIYRVLRYIKGKKSKEESFKFHFDAHKYTILIPIYIPKREGHDNGNLVILPNFRKFHKNLIKNIIQKIYFQSSYYRNYLKNNSKKNMKKLILKEKNIYIFNGFRSLHGNLNIHKEDQRATILLHYHDVIKDSKLIRINRYFRQFKESKKITK
jgi:hypothetical protein